MYEVLIGTWKIVGEVKLSAENHTFLSVWLRKRVNNLEFLSLNFPKVLPKAKWMKFPYLARRLNAILTRLCWWQKTIVLRSGKFFEAGRMIWKTEWICDLGQEILLWEAVKKNIYSIECQKFVKKYLSKMFHLKTHAICNLPLLPTGMLFRCWTHRSTATESPIWTMAVPSLVFKNFICRKYEKPYVINFVHSWMNLRGSSTKQLNFDAVETSIVTATHPCNIPIQADQIEELLCVWCLSIEAIYHHHSTLLLSLWYEIHTGIPCGRSHSRCFLDDACMCWRLFPAFCGLVEVWWSVSCEPRWSWTQKWRLCNKKTKYDFITFFNILKRKVI